MAVSYTSGGPTGESFTFSVVSSTTTSIRLAPHSTYFDCHKNTSASDQQSLQVSLIWSVKISLLLSSFFSLSLSAVQYNATLAASFPSSRSALGQLSLHLLILSLFNK